jgi:hypothetical protein
MTCIFHGTNISVNISDSYIQCVCVCVRVRACVLMEVNLAESN